MAVFVHLGFFALVSYLFIFTGRSILALRADPFGFFISSRLGVWGGGVVAWGHEEYPGWAHLPLTRLVQPETDIHPTGCMPGDTCRWKIGCIGLHSLLTIIRPERGNLPCDLGFMDQL